MKLLVTIHQTQLNKFTCTTSLIDNFLGIYIMFNGDSYPNGYNINHIYIVLGQPNYSSLQCVLPNSILSGGEWVNPNGQPVNCTKSTNNDSILCDVSNIEVHHVLSYHQLM